VRAAGYERRAPLGRVACLSRARLWADADDGGHRPAASGEHSCDQGLAKALYPARFRDAARVLRAPGRDQGRGARRRCGDRGQAPVAARCARALPGLARAAIRDEAGASLGAGLRALCPAHGGGADRPARRQGHGGPAGRGLQRRRRTDRDLSAGDPRRPGCEDALQARGRAFAGRPWPAPGAGGDQCGLVLAAAWRAAPAGRRGHRVSRAARAGAAGRGGAGADRGADRGGLGPAGARGHGAGSGQGSGRGASRLSPGASPRFRR